MGVAADAEAVLQEALTLSVEDRANVAAELLASLEAAEDLDEVERAWAAEIERRIDHAESEGFPGEDLTSIRQRLLDKHSS